MWVNEVSWLQSLGNEDTSSWARNVAGSNGRQQYLPDTTSPQPPCCCRDCRVVSVVAPNLIQVFFAPPNSQPSTDPC